MSRPRRMRTTPEWITFAVAVAVLAILVGGLVAQIVRSTDPARPVATVVDGGITERDGRFTVPVEVVNEGDHGAQAVQVGATLTAGGTTTSAEQTIDFLGAGERASVVFVFADDPRDGALEVAVDAFVEP